MRAHRNGEWKASELRGGKQGQELRGGECHARIKALEIAVGSIKNIGKVTGECPRF